MSLPDQIRTAIATAHRDIEQTPLATAMMEGAMDRTTYTWWLTQMEAIHTTLETAVRQSAYFATMPIIQAMDRTRDLAADLQAWNVSSIHLVESHVSEFLSQIEAWGEQAPWKLLGVVYVLEGSRMGSLMLAKPLARGLGVPAELGVGLDYHLQGAAERPRLWQQFRASLCMVNLTSEQSQAVQEAAVATMNCLYQLYRDAPCGAVAATTA